MLKTWDNNSTVLRGTFKAWIRNNAWKVCASKTGTCWALNIQCMSLWNNYFTKCLVQCLACSRCAVSFSHYREDRFMARNHPWKSNLPTVFAKMPREDWEGGPSTHPGQGCVSGREVVSIQCSSAFLGRGPESNEWKADTPGSSFWKRIKAHSKQILQSAGPFHMEWRPGEHNRITKQREWHSLPFLGVFGNRKECSCGPYH